MIALTNDTKEQDEVLEMRRRSYRSLALDGAIYGFGLMVPACLVRGACEAAHLSCSYGPHVAAVTAVWGFGLIGILRAERLRWSYPGIKWLTVGAFLSSGLGACGIAALCRAGWPMAVYPCAAGIAGLLVAVASHLAEVRRVRRGSNQ